MSVSSLIPNQKPSNHITAPSVFLKLLNVNIKIKGPDTELEKIYLLKQLQLNVKITYLVCIWIFKML